MASGYTFWDKFLVQDAGTLDLMKGFPLHKFRSNPVAYVPMYEATRGGLVAAIYESGSVAALRPTLHDVKEVEEEEEEEESQERFLAAGVSGYEGELAVALWDSTAQAYKVDFYRVESYSFKRVGSAPLRLPKPGAVLCGFAHTGGGLVCVWLDGSLQIYGPRDEGLALLQSYKLTGFDFSGMQKKCGTEDLRSLPVGMSVCERLGEKDLVLIVGPSAGKQGLKYVSVDAKTGMLQARGVLLEKMLVDAPVKVLVVDAMTGRVRVVIGDKDGGEQVVPVRPNSLARRLGSQASQSYPRKRKLEDQAEGSQSPPNVQEGWTNEEGFNQPAGVTFSLPTWVQELQNSMSISSASPNKKPCLERLRIPEDINDGRSGDSPLSKTIVQLVSTFSRLDQDERTVVEALETLAECKRQNIVLTVDLAGMTAGAIAQLDCGWEKLEALIEACPLRSLCHCPNLVSKLVNSSQFELMNRVLGSLDFLSGEEVRDALDGILNMELSTEQSISQSDYYDKMATAAMTSISDAESCSLQELQTVLPRIQRQVACVDRFSPTEILLHSVLRVPVDMTSLREGLSNLSSRAARQLLVYLGKWINKHQKFLLQVFQNTEADSWPVPDRDTVVDWLTALISCQIPALSGSIQHKKVVEALKESIQGWTQEIRSNLLCKGSLEAILDQSSSVLDKESSPYVVVPLDLGISET